MQNTGDHESECEGSATDTPSKPELVTHASPSGKEKEHHPSSHLLVLLKLYIRRPAWRNICCLLFCFCLLVFLLLNRRVMKLKNTRQKKKTTESPLSCTHWIPQYTRRCFSATCNYKSFHADKKKKSFYADVLEKIGFPRTHHFVWEDTASKLVELPIMAIFIH